MLELELQHSQHNRILDEKTEELKAAKLSAQCLESELRLANEKLDSMDILQQKVDFYKLEVEKAQEFLDQNEELLKSYSSQLDLGKQERERILAETMARQQEELEKLERLLSLKDQEIFESTSLLDSLKISLKEEAKSKDSVHAEATITHQTQKAQLEQDLLAKEHQLKDLVLMLETMNSALIEARSNMDSQGLQLSQVLQENQSLQEKSAELQSSLMLANKKLAKESSVCRACFLFFPKECYSRRCFTIV